MVDIDEDLNTEVADQISLKESISLLPLLNNEKGYFALGPESTATDVFLFNIFVCFGNNVQLAFPKDVKVSSTDEIHFTYDLFGTQISSKPFYWTKIDAFNPERATAKIYTTPEKLVQFFNEKMKLFCFFVTVQSQSLALAEVDLSKLVEMKNIEDLKAGKLFLFESVLPLAPVKQNPNEEPPVLLRKSESMVDHPSLGVRISVGLKPDPGTKDEYGVKEPIEVPDKIWAPIPTKIEPPIEVPDKIWAPNPTKLELPKKSSDVTMEDITNTKDHETDASTMSEHPEIMMQPQLMEVDGNLDEPILRYKFTMDLKKIKLNLDYPVQCVIKYKYKPFCATEVSTQPAFRISPDSNSVAQDIRRGYCEYSFSAKESALQKPLEKHPLHIKIFDQQIEGSKWGPQELYLGTASLKLNALFSSEASRTLDCKSCSAQVPILKKNKVGSADIIGFIYCQFTLKELPSTMLETSNNNVPKSAFSPVKPREMDKSLLELEEWKKKQKDRFKDQLQGLETHHIQTLSKEWEKREKERENLIHEKLDEIMRIEKELKKSLEENRQKNKQLDTYNEKLNERAKKLDDREERLKTMLGKNSKISLDKIQDKVKELQKENESLKTDVQHWKIKV